MANTMVTWMAMGPSWRSCMAAVVALGQHCGDLDLHRAIMEVMHGGGGTPLSAVRPWGMGVIPKKALDMYGSLHLTILYLLRGEQEDLEDKSRASIRDIGG